MNLAKLSDMLRERQDVVLAVFIVSVIFMMIVPLPTWLVDVLIAFNMSISVVLLMVAVYLKSPLDFAAFPAVLLITTLFRLSISISTTRLILLNGDAGHIVEAFGEFVVGGNLVVGIVIFLILTIVNFIVITKGAERVAEVGARFSLDAMPGNPSATAAWCITRIEGRNTFLFAIASVLPKQVWSRRWAARATATTTRWPRRSTGSTRPS